MNEDKCMMCGDETKKLYAGVCKDCETLHVRDNINHPKHYNIGSIEVIDVIEDWGLDFHLGNAVKYIARAKHKEKFHDDIQKAIWYLQRSLINTFGSKKTSPVIHTEVKT